MSEHHSNCVPEDKDGRELMEAGKDSSSESGSNSPELVFEGKHESLVSLPSELLLSIFAFLDASFLMKTVMKVCKRFQLLLSSDMYWKSRINYRWPKKYPAVEVPEEMNWKHACMEREHLWKLWSNKENMQHIKFTEGLYASVDTVHLMQTLKNPCNFSLDYITPLGQSGLLQINENEEGTLLASGSRDRYLTLLDLNKLTADDQKTQQEALILSEDRSHQGWVWCLDSWKNLLCSGCWDSYIRLWDLADHCTLTSKFKCRSAILKIHIEQNFIAAGGYDSHLYLIDTRVSLLERKKVHRQAILCLAVDDRFIITGSEDHTISVQDRRMNSTFKQIMLDNYPMAMSYGRNQLWVGDKVGKIHLIDATSSDRFEVIQTYDVGHRGKMTGIKHTLGAMFTGSTDKTVKVLEPSLDPGIIATLSEHQGEVAELDFQNDILATAGSDICVGIWRPRIEGTGCISGDVDETQEDFNQTCVGEDQNIDADVQNYEGADQNHTVAVYNCDSADQNHGAAVQTYAGADQNDAVAVCNCDSADQNHGAAVQTCADQNDTVAVCNYDCAVHTHDEDQSLEPVVQTHEDTDQNHDPTDQTCEMTG